MENESQSTIVSQSSVADRPQKLRYRRLVRSALKVDAYELTAPLNCSFVCKSANRAVMGGSLAEPLKLTIPKLAPKHSLNQQESFDEFQMLRRLKEKDVHYNKEKTDKLQLIVKDEKDIFRTNSKKDKNAHKSKESPSKDPSKTDIKDQTKKDSKRSKFAERIRRSFQRGVHKSLDSKVGTHGSDSTAAVSETTLKANSQSIISLTHLPGLGGHVNTALLLDSPEEGTPPEFGYHYLSSIATTTNSSTSIDSNLDCGDTHISHSSICHWVWPHSEHTEVSMGAELSTGSTTAVTGSIINSSKEPFHGEGKEKEKLKKQRRLEAPYTPRMEWISGGGGSSDSALVPYPSAAPSVSTSPTPAPVPTPSSGLTASRSCSITSETSSSTRIGRLHNFLFKSSNESSRSMQGHSNEGFTASSHNSSSGEWEMLANYGSLQPTAQHDFSAVSSSFAEEESNDYGGQTTVGGGEKAAASYTQYTLTSPNNPFLPEITARTYHDRQHCEDDMLDVNVTSVKWEGLGLSTGSGSLSAHFPSPAYSRAGSQESTQSDSAIGCRSRARLPAPPGHKATLAPSSAAMNSTSQPAGTRQKRKLFSMNSPTRLLHHRPVPTQQKNSTEKSLDKQAWLFSAVSAKTNTLKTSASTGKLRSFNPFSSQSSQSTSSAMTLKRVGPTKQAAITSPGPVEGDVKRICLLLPPLSNKLQIKSKSLTHLDGLYPAVSCTRGITPVSVGHTNVSTNDYFSVSYCNDHGYQEEEFIPARFGQPLGAALTTTLKRRNLGFCDVYVIYSGDISSKYIETGNFVPQDALREDTDVSSLAGKHLVILERNPTRQTIQKAAAFGVRSHPPTLVTSVSTDEHTQFSWQKQNKSTSKNPDQTSLVERLNRIYQGGAIQKPKRLPFQHPQIKEALAYLDCVHMTWRDFIPGLAEDNPESKIQTALWELVTTEASYIRAMQVVTDLFMFCLEAVQQEDVLREINLCDLFSNARQIVDVNLNFWTFYIFPMVSESLSNHLPMRYTHMITGFSSFPNIFEAYKVFCAEQTKCQHYCKELNRFNSIFTGYLSWCESQKACNRLRLADLLVRPMQRLTKYSLLLAAIKKHMVGAYDIEQMDTMIKIVDRFVLSVNVHLTTCQETERLKGVMARIESYDVVDAHTDILQRMVEIHSNMFDLTGSMIGCADHHTRHLFMEGDHKFKDGQSKADVHCFLFTDILLICKSVSKKHSETLKVIRHPYFTDRLSMHLNESHSILSCVYLNEFNVAVAGFTLQCSEAKCWFETFRRAKNIYMRLKQDSMIWDGLRFAGLGPSISQIDGFDSNSQVASRNVSSNSCNGSFEWCEARPLSMETENTWNDEDQSATKKTKKKPKPKQPPKTRIRWQPLSLLNLGQSLPNLNTNQSNINLYHTYSNNTLHVPETSTGTSQSGNLLLSPDHRGKSYPPPSPNRVPLRRGNAFSNTSKNPPLVKTRNITSQASVSSQHGPTTPGSSPNKLGSYSSLLRSTSANETTEDTYALPSSSFKSPALTYQQQLQPPPITMSSNATGDEAETTTIQLYSPEPNVTDTKNGETYV